MNIDIPRRPRLAGYIHTWFVGALELAPLPVFLLCLSGFQSHQSGRWAEPYYLSSLVAAATTLAMVLKGRVLNRLAIGINLYLLSGSVAQLLHWEWLNRFYGEVLAAGMLLWIVAVGALSTWVSAAGFVGVRAENGSQRRASAALLAVAAAALGLSLHFTGNRLLSELLPFVLLFAAHGRLRAVLLTSEVSNVKSGG